jgi:hypothetical protein
MDLDQQFAGKRHKGPGDLQILEGKLTKKQGKFWVRIDNDPQLWGPVIGGTDANINKTVVIAVTQKSRPFVIYPQ